MGTGGSFPWLRRLERTGDHSPAISVEIKNEWSYNPPPPIRFHGREKDKFTFFTFTFTTAYYMFNYSGQQNFLLVRIKLAHVFKALSQPINFKTF
jgi:hypothetical protein